MTRQFVGSYRLLEEIGRGGSSVVYAAEDPREPGKRLALKVIEAESPEATAAFSSVARIEMSLRHERIVQVFDAGQAGSKLFIAMELLNGVTSAELSGAAGPLPVGAAVGLILQVAEGLAHAHELVSESGASLELVHRDIKPSNLFLQTSGEARVIDFGIAKSNHSDRSRTRTGTFRGTLAYASPEQARAEAIDGRSDLFSLALVLHQLLTGTPLFERGTDAGTLSAILFEPAPPIRAQRPEVPAAVDRLVGWALQKTPNERPASVRQWARALRTSIPEDELWTSGQLAALLNQCSVPARRAVSSTSTHQGFVSASPGARRGLSRSRLFAPTAAVLLLLVLALFILRPRAGTEDRAENERSVSEKPTPAAVSAPVERAPAASMAAVPTPRRERRQTKPAEVPHKTAARPTAAEGVVGWVSVNVRPGWSTIRVDGKELGPTPLFRQTLPAGVHQIEAIHPDGRRQSKQVRVPPNGEEKLLFEW